MAYTLLELMIVLAILGLIAGTVAINWKRPADAAQIRNAIAIIKLVDRQTRTHVKAQGRSCRITLDLENNTVSAQRWSVEFGYTDLKRKLPGVVRVSVVRTAKKKEDEDRFSYTINRQGSSPSLAIQLSGRQKSVWLGVVGGTGQILEPESIEDYVKAIQNERLNFD